MARTLKFAAPKRSARKQTASRSTSFLAQIEQDEQDNRREDLRDAIKALGLNHSDFARVVDVDVRTVRRWLEGTRSIDGPTGVLLWLFADSPKAMKHMLDVDVRLAEAKET